MAETISDTQLRLQTFITDNFPEADVAPGTVLNELLIKLDATLQNPITNTMSDLGQANSISAALASTTDTFNSIIDAIASNYNVTRNQGLRSVGTLKVVVAKNQSYYLPPGFTFVQPVLSLNYATTAQYHITPNPSVAGDIQLFNANNQFYFLLPVVAAAVGSQFQVSANAQFALGTNQNISGFVSASAYGSFTTGLPEETDKALIARIQTGLNNKTLLTPASILSRLQDIYPTLIDLSVIGANDEEMTRSKQNVFGISTLGMADVYIRNCLGPQTIQITKTATQTNNVWTLTFDFNDVPGFYRIVSILPSGQNLAGTLVTTQNYSYSTAGITPTNTINNVQEARFSKYQTCTATFAYTSTATSADFDILLSYQPNIEDIQNLMLSSAERIACADYLVKAALPCFVSVAVNVHPNNPTTTLPTGQMQQDIYNYINTIKFGDHVYVSKIVEICHKYDIQYVQLPITLTGDIYGNDSSVTSISGTDVLQIPTNLNIGVSPKTTLFFADYLKTGASDLQNSNSMSQSISVSVI